MPAAANGVTPLLLERLGGGDHLIPRGRRRQVVLREDLLVVVDLERRHLERDAVDLAVLLAAGAVQRAVVEVGQSADLAVERRESPGVDQRLQLAVTSAAAHVRAAGLGQARRQDRVVLGGLVRLEVDLDRWDATAWNLAKILR